MKYKLGFFYNKNPEALGGGGTNANNQATDPNEDDSQGGSDDTGDSGSDFSGESLHNAYHGLNSKGERPKSAIAEALKELEDEESGGSDDEKEGDAPVKEKARKDDSQKTKEEETKEELTTEELLKAEARNKDGRPLTLQSSKLIEQLKSKITTLSEEGKKYQAPEIKQKLEEYDSLKTQLTETLEKNKQLQERFDEEFFESSDAFKEAIEKPYEKAFEKVAGFFNHYDKKDPDDKVIISEVASLLKEAAAASAAGDTATLLDKVEDMSKFIKGQPGGAVHNAFYRAMDVYAEAAANQVKAYQEKGENRKKLVETRVTESRSQKIGSVESDLSSFLKKFEADQKVFTEHLPDDLRTKYVDSYKSNEKIVKGALAKYAVSGQIPQELNTVIAKGVAYDATVQEKVLAWGAFKDADNQNKMLKEEVNKLKTTLSKYTGKREGGEGRVSSGSVVSKTTGKRSAIFANLKEVGALQDDD